MLNNMPCLHYPYDYIFLHSCSKPTGHKYMMDPQKKYQNIHIIRNTIIANPFVQ